MGNETNTDNYDDFFPDQLNSGATYISQLRQMTQYQGNGSIGINTSYYDFDGSTYIAWENPWNTSDILVNNVITS